MNHYAYAQRRKADLEGIKFKMQKLFSFLHHSDYEEIQAHLNQASEILKKYQ